ncbi:hypothetical protein ABLO07_14365, partial [Mycobacterium tuberculosis]
LTSVCSRCLHCLVQLISLVSLYRYLSKFPALGEGGYVLISMTQVFALALVLLSLEFVPRRRHL